jgi:hypothetical protein
VIVDAQTGAEADPVLVDRNSGRPLVDPAFRSAAGPAADARTRQRHAFVASEQAKAKESPSVKSPDASVR